MNKFNKSIIKYFLISHVICYLTLYLLYPLLQTLQPGLNFFTVFDGLHYLNISKYGYNYQYNEYAFFPFFPIILKVLGKYGTIIYNNILNLLSGFLIFNITKKYLKNKDPLKTVKLYFFCPITIFSCLLYTESTFIFLTLLFFLFYKEKKNYILTGILLGLSVATRATASMLFFTIFIFMVIDIAKKQERVINLFKIFIPATIISSLYPIYLFVKEGDLLLFSHIQYSEWNKEKSNVIHTIIIQIKKILTMPDISSKVVFTIELLMYFYFIYLLIYSIKKYFKVIPESIIYAILTFLIVSSCCFSMKVTNGAMVSYHRYFYACYTFFFITFEKNIFF